MVFGVYQRGTAQILIAQNRNIFCGIDTSSNAAMRRIYAAKIGL